MNIACPYPKVLHRGPSLSAHPWVYRQNLRDPNPDVPSGIVVDLAGPDGSFWARGFYARRGRVAIKILTRSVHEIIDRGFFLSRLESAWRHRQKSGVIAGSASGYRLIHGEGDGLPGLCVDVYAGWAVAMVYGRGVYLQRDLLDEGLRSLPGILGVAWIFEDAAADREGFPSGSDIPGEVPTEIDLVENGALYQVRLNVRHKTGFYLDQRVARGRFRDLVSRGDRVADLCSFTGGFAINAALAGAQEVLAVDIDPDAIAQVAVHAQNNKVAVQGIHADVRKWLVDQEHGSWDVINLDPARAARSDEGVAAALRLYRDLNGKAMRLLRSGGILMTHCCSARIEREDFLRALRAAARDSQREIQVVEAMDQPGDHPWNIHCPESRYLKSFILRAQS